MRILALMLGLSALAIPGVALAAPCSAPTTTGDVALSLEAAEAAFGQLDGMRFLTVTEQAPDALPCVTDPVSRSLAPACTAPWA